MSKKQAPVGPEKPPPGKERIDPYQYAVKTFPPEVRQQLMQLDVPLLPPERLDPPRSLFESGATPPAESPTDAAEPQAPAAAAEAVPHPSEVPTVIIPRRRSQLAKRRASRVIAAAAATVAIVAGIVILRSKHDDPATPMEVTRPAGAPITGASTSSPPTAATEGAGAAATAPSAETATPPPNAGPPAAVASTPSPEAGGPEKPRQTSNARPAGSTPADRGSPIAPASTGSVHKPAPGVDPQRPITRKPD